MSGPKTKLAKRLVLGLAAVAIVGGLTAFAIMPGQLFSEAPVADGDPGPAAELKEPDNVQPIPLPTGDAVPPGSMVASVGGDGGQSVSLAAYEVEAPENPGTPKDFLLPPPSTIIRANDGETAATVSTPPATEAVSDAGVSPDTVPPSPPMPEFDSPADLNPPSPPADVTVAGPGQTPTPAGPEPEPPAALDGSLRDAARAAITDNGSDASIYGSGPATGATPAETATESQFEATISDAAPANDQTAPIYATPTPAVDMGTPSPTLPPTEPTTGSVYSPNPSLTEPSFNSAAAGDARPFEGDGTPGTNSLEGLQSPALTLEKTAPEEIQVGKETEFQLKVRNVGTVAAQDVIVLDRVPRGTRFVNAKPQANRTSDGQLMWQLGTLQPGDETMITVQLLPTTEGEIGSVAQVLFAAQASARTVCTKPELKLTYTAPEKVMIGEAVTFDITVSNPGTGAATGIVLEENVPEGLAHIKGNELAFEVGTLKPGETRRMQLALKADGPGIIENVLLARGDGNLIAKDSAILEVIAPSLEVALSGPSLRFLEREATYEVAVSNPGTATAREVELVTYLPKGMKFLSADHKGQYESQNHAVYWSLEELPANEMGVAKLTLLPLETGEQKLSVEGRAALGIEHSHDKLVRVDGLAELEFDVADVADPIEVGSDTTYTITLNNSGSSAATNIRLALNLPPSLKPVGGDGPTRVVVDGAQVAIDPLARLAPGEQAVYKLKVQGLDAGAQRIQVQLITNETPIAVAKEEVTRVYLDR